MMVLMLVFYFMADKKARNIQDGTHPGYIERIMNIVQSFRQELMYANITELDIKRLMRY